MYLNKLEYQFVDPLDICVTLDQQNESSKLRLKVTPIVIRLEHWILDALQKLSIYIFLKNKNNIINQSIKSGEVFLKVGRWKKCFISLNEGCLYGWDN